MAKLPIAPPEENAEAGQKNPLASQAVISRHVLAELGRPVDLLRITVRQVTSDNYRVNVVAGPDPSSARIAHSFFITADDAGNITGSTPKIVKQY